MRICIIGGTGHIGSCLVPILVKDKHEVMVISSGRSEIPWRVEQNVTMLMGRYVRGSAEWATLIQNIRPEAIIDLLGIDLPATYNAAKKSCAHFIACGSVWMYGPPRIVPTPEITQGDCEFEAYEKRYEAILFVKEQATHDGIAFTAIMPPNICGPGKIPLEASGSRVIAVHKAHQQGEVVYLPEKCNTLIGPCDVSDVAQGFYLAIQNRDKAADEIFNVGSSYAMTAPRFIEVYGEIYKKAIPVQEVQWGDFLKNILPERGANYHFREHMAPDITKIKETLGYKPVFTPEESMERAVQWMREENLI